MQCWDVLVNKILAVGDVSKGTDFSDMFKKARAFDEYSGWNVGKGTDFSYMFEF